jgi:hypothetical protein
MKKKRMDERLRRALLALDVQHTLATRGPESFMHELIFNAANLIRAISDRSNTPGLEGHQKNYITCKRIAELRIKLEQATMVWSGDNIDTFDGSMMHEIENTIRVRRAERPPRRTWPHCKRCGGLVDQSKSHDTIPVPFAPGEKYFICHKCVD